MVKGKQRACVVAARVLYTIKYRTYKGCLPHKSLHLSLSQNSLLAFISTFKRERALTPLLMWSVLLSFPYRDMTNLLDGSAGLSQWRSCPRLWAVLKCDVQLLSPTALWCENPLPLPWWLSLAPSSSIIPHLENICCHECNNQLYLFLLLP